MNKDNTVAFMYDFDETLAPNYMQDYNLIPDLGYEPGEFWGAVNEYGKERNIDSVCAYLYFCVEKAKEKGIVLSYDKLYEYGTKLHFFKGVETWFDRINAYGKELGLNIEHYIISSGMIEMIKGTSIAKYFKEIFACKYIFNEKGEPIWVGNAVNYTNKTQYLFKIRKHDTTNINDSKVVNSRIPENEKIPFSNMVYFGDGFTDIPCMTVVKEKGGHSVCVYRPEKEKSRTTADKLYNEDRVQFIAPSDYSEGSELDQKIKATLKHLSLELIQKAHE